MQRNRREHLGLDVGVRVLVAVLRVTLREDAEEWRTFVVHQRLGHLTLSGMVVVRAGHRGVLSERRRIRVTDRRNSLHRPVPRVGEGLAHR